MSLPLLHLRLLCGELRGRLSQAGTLLGEGGRDTSVDIFENLLGFSDDNCVGEGGGRARPHDGVSNGEAYRDDSTQEQMGGGR